MADTDPDPRTWAGVSEFEFARLLRRGRTRGRLSLDEVLDVVRDADLTPELIAEVRTTLAAEGIELDDTVVVVEDDEDEEILKLLRPGRPKASDRRGRAAPVDKGSGGDSTRLYLREIGEVALLSAAEEVDLATAIAAGAEAESTLADLAAAGRLDELDGVELATLRRRQRKGEQARDRLTRANLRLVVSVAKRYSGRGLPLLDLVQEGNLGLMRAVEKFDAGKGFKFSTYATWWIRQAVARAVADQARTIRIPVHMVDAMNRVIRAQRDLQQELERAPSIDEVADRAAVEPKRAEELLGLDRSQVPLSLDSPMGEEHDTSLADILADLDAVDPDTAAARRLMGEEVVAALDDLDEREQGVVRMRFGLGDGKPKTLEEVGRHFNVTRERVRQIETRTMAKLRHPLRSKKLRDYLEDA